MTTNPAGPSRMMPESKFVTLTDTEAKIEELLRQTIVEPRIKLIEWSRYTKQTANIKIGYPGQHLASLVTGVEGTRTGARGHDLRDGSEVKSCSRIDQLDKCRDCGAGVARSEDVCPACNGTNIKRNNDSKWLFGVRSDDELKQLVGYDRVLLMLGDYPKFDGGDFSTLRFQAFEIWPQAERSSAFAQLMTGYYENIYKPKLEQTGKQPAPKNFWPYSFQFYKCAPVRTMCTTVTDADTDPKINVDFLFDPSKDRSVLSSPSMPSAILNAEERKKLQTFPSDLLEGCLVAGVTTDEYRRASAKNLAGMLGPIPPDALAALPLRDTDKPVTQATAYRRAAII